ncbi:alpha/beta fold hydrolase [Paracidovorax anthurii]|uniref:Pimeloyl-ACP methyl ester carboxylesterase n=1 Tax=Paracidovorax anthurii TaxID=78229 RepID=A0A328YW21_9BURK|nr:alpha/beta fold hydrolase [Paracidovorax anthurii]RAR78158.1 pimeloyl-ACP methyl ester carboxylesterase [Paracidovorax anthurii]
MNLLRTMQHDEQPAGDRMAALEQRMQRHVVQSHGGQVVWWTLGSGRPLVLLHGGHGSWRHWVRNVEALTTHRSVWVPDMPGYGDSDAPAEPTIGSLLDRLTGSLDALLGPSTSIDLAGFSFGGLVAAHLAVGRRGVDRLALLGPAGHGGPRRPRSELVSWRHVVDDAAALAQVMRHNLLAHMLHQPDSVDPLALRVHTEACLQTRFRSKGISRAGGLQALLHQATCPVLLAWGAHDVTATPELLAPELAACHPRSRTAIVADAGHWVQYESAPAINALLRDWLA